MLKCDEAMEAVFGSQIFIMAANCVMDVLTICRKAKSLVNPAFSTL